MSQGLENSPAPQRPPQPYSEPPLLDLPPSLDADFSGFDLSDQSEPIESISPFQTTTYSLLLDTAEQGKEGKRNAPLASHNCSVRMTRSGASTPSTKRSSGMRLKGVMSAVSLLDSELQTKDNAIADLRREVEYRNSMIETLRAESAEVAGGKERRAQSTLNLLMRRKEKEQERRIRELELRAAEDEKTIRRLKHMNKQLIITAEQTPSQCLSTASDGAPSSKRLNSELQRLRLLHSALTQRLTACEQQLASSGQRRCVLETRCRQLAEAAETLAQSNVTLAQDLQRLLV